MVIMIEIILPKKVLLIVMHLCSLGSGKCSRHCKPLSEFEVNAIVSFRAAFDLSVEEVRQALAKCDSGCPNGHYTKVVGSLPVDLRGQPYCLLHW